MAFDSGSTERKVVQHGGAVAAGAVGGPVAAGLWEVGAPIVMDWLGGNGQDDAEANQRAGMQSAANMYAAYRPQVSQARNNALNSQLSAYNGAGNALGLMYGNDYNPKYYAPDLGKNPWEGTSPVAVATKPPTQAEKDQSQYETDMGASMANHSVRTASSSSVPGVETGAGAFGFYGGEGGGGSLGTLPKEILAYQQKYGQVPTADAVNDYMKYGVWTPPKGA